MIKIENGTMKQPNGSYRYEYTTEKDGHQVVFFTAAPGEIPEIGDFIDNNKLIKRVGYQINNDGRMKWPSDNKDGYDQFGNLYDK